MERGENAKQNYINSGRAAQDKEELHRRRMADVGNYRHLKKGDPDFAPAVADVLARRAEKAEGEAIVSTNKKKQPCAKCSQLRSITGRGLCATCYSKERAAGSLEVNYPKKVAGGVMKEPEGVQILDEAVAEEAVPAQSVDEQREKNQAKRRVCLDFGWAEAGLILALENIAKKNRRSLNMEILCQLERAVAGNFPKDNVANKRQ